MECSSNFSPSECMDTWNPESFMEQWRQTRLSVKSVGTSGFEGGEPKTRCGLSQARSPTDHPRRHFSSGDHLGTSPFHMADLLFRSEESQATVMSCHELQADKRGKAVVAESGFRPENACSFGT